MKKYLLTWALITITATTLYATTAGSTVVDAMKAASHAFTLATNLNPGQTGLTSEPVKGKKTGDMLTAGEWNRVLELVSEGGSGGGGSGWVDVPLTDTADFDDSCMYRYQITYSAGGREPYVPKETYYYANGMSKTQLVWWLENDSQNTTYHIAASSKNLLRINGNPYTTWGVSVTKIEKLCGGGGSSGFGATSIKTKTPIVATDTCSSVCSSESKSCVVGFLHDLSFSSSSVDALRRMLDCTSSVPSGVSGNSGYALACLCSSGGGGSTSGVGTNAPSVISCKKKNSTYSTSTLTGQSLVKFTASDCGGTLPDASYNGAIGSLNVCNGAIDHTVYSGGSVNGPWVSFSFRGWYACTWSDGSGYDISVVYMK